MVNLHALFKKSILALLFTCSYALGGAQVPAGKPYTVGKIPQLYKFENLTAREARLDTGMLQHWEGQLVRMEDGSAFREGASAADKASAITHHKARFRRYKDNRSRYYLTAYTNGTTDKAPFLGMDTVTTDCDCTLAGDTLNIKMGIWVFGGFAINLQLTGNNFKSIYWEDTHEQKIYRAKPGDTLLTDNVHVEDVESALVLDRQSRYKLGENLLGYFTFTTAGYYRLRYPEGVDVTTFDKLRLSGSLHFKCVVSALPEGDR